MGNFICLHCKGEFDQSVATKDESGHEFCCNGCMNVYGFLNSHNLSEFYDKLGNQKHFKAPNLTLRHFIKIMSKIVMDFVKFI